MNSFLYVAFYIKSCPSRSFQMTSFLNGHSFNCDRTRVRRCRIRQIFGVAKDFCPNYTKLARTVFVRLFSPAKIMKTFFGMNSKKIKKDLHVFLQTLGATFSNQTKLSTNFSRIFRDFAQILQPFSGILPRFSRILPRF